MPIKNELMQTAKTLGDGTAVSAGLASWIGGLPLPEIVAVLTAIWLTISISGACFKGGRYIWNRFKDKSSK